MTSKPLLHRQHVLSNPELYLGTTREVKQQLWIIQNSKPVLKNIFFVPAILKIYDELLINAAQHKVRDESTSFIQITVKDNGVITFVNDGKSLPFDLVNEHVYIISSIFGQCEQSSIYYRMGHSVKLANLFSRYFYVETGNKNKKTALKIDWRNNMSKMDPPQTRPYMKIDYTKISAALDLSRFGIKKLSPEFIGLLQRRAYDIAGLNRIKVYFNEKQVSFSSLNEYAQLFANNPQEIFCGTLNKSSHWKVIFLKSNKFQQMSFVNNCIWTKKGGTHVNHVISQIAKKALEAQKKRLRDPQQIMSNPQKFKSNYMLFVSICIQNAIFDTVTKDSLMTPISKFQSLYHLSQQGLQFLQKNGQLQAYKEMAKQRDQRKIEQQIKRKIIRAKVIVPKLDDAFNAGLSSRCTLVIVENDSMKQLVSTGLQCINRDYFGIYTTKNKLGNARQMSTKQMSENADFSAIIKALGLTIGKEYSNIDSLRYSSILLVGENNSEGANFKGLLLNFLQSFWPSLFRYKGFIKVFVPPAVRCVNALGSVKIFPTKSQFAQWSMSNSINQWIPTYYGHLAAMSVYQIKEIFGDFKKYCFTLSYQGLLDQDALRIVYMKKPNEAKKKWLQGYNHSSPIQYNINTKAIGVKEFVDKQLIHFHYHQYVQIVPCALDGLNLPQRKIISCLLKMGADKEIKINQLTGQILEETTHLSESIVQSNIISLGQCFAGTNNINLIKPIGQYGTRFMNGKDSAPYKYLLASLPLLTRLLFPQDDQNILEYQEADKRLPKSFIPILPLLLINGYAGTDNLWSSIVHPHKMTDVIDLIKGRIKNQNAYLVSLNPWWQGFKGKIVQQKKGVFQIKGIYEVRPNNTVIVSQIPPNKSYREYRAFLQSKLGNANNSDIQSIRQQQKGQRLIFLIKFHPTKMPPQSDLQRYLKLIQTIQDGPMTLVNRSGTFKKYETLQQVLQEYYQARLRLYQKRKESLMSHFLRNIEIISQKSRFIRDVLRGQFRLSENQQTWNTKFMRKFYTKYQYFPQTNTNKQYEQSYKDYEYLMKLNINDFSQRKISELLSQKEEISTKLQELKTLSAKSIWLKQIEGFQQAWRQFNRIRDKQVHESIKKTQSLYKQQPSQRSLKKKSNEQDLSQISIDSQVRAELQKHLLQVANETKTKLPTLQKTIQKQDPSKDQTIPEVNPRIHKREFEQMIRQMQRRNNQYQERVKREAVLNKHKKLQQPKTNEPRQNQKNNEKAATVLKEANNRREALGRHAQQIGKNVQQFRRQEELKQKSEQSERNHLPKPSNPTPRITVPFKCDSSTFQVNHVQRKRFPTSRPSKSDQVDLKRIAAELKQKEQEELRREQARMSQVNTCIDLDAD